MKITQIPCAFQIVKLEIKAATLVQAKKKKKKPTWHDARIGCLTTSHFGAVVCQKRETVPDNLVKTVMGSC